MRCGSRADRMLPSPAAPVGRACLARRTDGARSGYLAGCVMQTARQGRLDGACWRGLGDDQRRLREHASSDAQARDAGGTPRAFTRRRGLVSPGARALQRGLADAGRRRPASNPADAAEQGSEDSCVHPTV